MKNYKCSVCGYVYDPILGDKEGGIPENTAFDSLPEDWTCPICRVGKASFLEVD